MHDNRNKNAMKRVEKGMMKANSTRNLFAMSAIILTTFMITTVFSLAINYIENMNLMQMRTLGTAADVSLAMPTKEQEQKITSLDYVKTVGVRYMAGSISRKNAEGREFSIVLQYYDTTEWEKHYQKAISGFVGKYPANENEIMLSEDALSQLGIKAPELYMEIPLSYSDRNGRQERIFILSGWFHSYTGTGMGFVSESCCKNAGCTMAEDGVLSLSLKKMPDDFLRIQRDVKLNENQLATTVSFGFVPLFLEKGFNQGKSAMEAVVFFHPSIYILSILFSAFTVWIACNAPAKAAAKTSPIEALKYQNFAPQKTKNRNSKNGGKLYIMAFHNVFRDRKRAILVFMSLFMGITMILGVNGIVGSYKAENYVKQYMDYNFEYADIQVRQYEQLQKEVPQFDEHFIEQIEQIEGIKNVDIQKIVWAGIDFDESDFGDFMKIKYEDSSYKADRQSYEQMLAGLRAYANAGEYGCYITTLMDERILEEYNENHPKTTIDLEAFWRGEIVITGWDSDYNAPNAALVGKTLTLTAKSADGKATDFLVGGAFDFMDDTNRLSTTIGHHKMVEIVPDIIYVSEAGMERLTGEALISGIGVDIEDINDLERVDSELQGINRTLTTAEWDFKSTVDTVEQFNQMIYAQKLLGNGVAALLIVIGLINFVNVMVTGVAARKNEFAIMESIGTTKKQLRKILTVEGGIYALISTLLILTFGNAFLMLVADAVPNLADYAVFEYPVGLVIRLIAAIFVICLSVPGIVYKLISNETVIERMRSFDN